MKIGLISPYRSQNYGTVLQAFALAYILKQKGIGCEYINYSVWKKGSKINYLLFLLKHPFFIISKKWTQHLNRKDLKYSHVREPWFSEVIKKNNIFVNENIPYSTKTYTYDTLNELPETYSKFIIGSDQTWSPFHELYYSMFFLEYDKYGKLYSYAPSLGTTVPTQGFLKFLSRKIQKMRLASCRELCNSRLLTKTSGINIECVLDPTLLLTKAEWLQYIEPVPNMPLKYILCYILGEREDISTFAEDLGKEKKIPVYYITTRNTYRSKNNSLENIGVCQFLYLINNATYVVTDSFHCTIFSINFNRDFYCFDKMPGISYDNGRLKDVLSQFRLENRLLKVKGAKYSSINYSEVNNLLNRRRDSSIQFLEKIISD